MIAAVALAFSILAFPALGDDMRGAVTKVVDGDTFYLEGGPVRLRLWGIDTPERGDYGYRQAGQHLAAITAGAELVCDHLYTDRYDRPVARCAVSGDDLGALMVLSGWARDYARYSDGEYQDEEEAARASGVGLWR